MSKIIQGNFSGSTDGAAGGGSGGNTMLEARVGRLEDDAKELKADMKVVRGDLAELKGKVSMLPGYPGIAVIVGVVGGAVTILAKFIQVGG